MAAEATDSTARKGPSTIIQLVVLLVLTIAAAGGGWFSGMQLKSGSEGEEPAETVKIQVDPVPGSPEAEEAAAAHGGGHAEEGAPDDVARDENGNIILIPRLVPLEPVTTNLAAPRDIWVRMELAIVFSAPPPPQLVRTIHEDILAYMRTVTLQQVQGASGFRHLKTDLEERARIRSDGLATQLMIRTLLFE
ncbi:flagellar basal body-associated FliL family protein [Aquibium microcysteis]|uniref:flagellar basal body-associated FliL family protein n=1 Tax=Aquibium microcysteis TaxID=675281 RepID=UPI00165D0491|nr:flagellar basal body-associated FliL family protein [Aquibium microcysteis]